MMKIKPLGERIVIKMLPEPEMFEGSILFKPETVHQTAIGYGIIQAFGKHKLNVFPGYKEATEYKVGQKLLYIKFLVETGTSKGVMRSLGDDTIIIEFKDVLGIVEED